MSASSISGQDASEGDPPPLRGARRAAFLILGCVMLLLGIVGAFLPVMPSTIFLILAAWSFGRSSPRLESWMLNHSRFGPILRSWREQGAISRPAKITACFGMVFGYALSLITTRPEPLLAVGLALLLIGCAVYVATRPEPKDAGERFH